MPMSKEQEEQLQLIKDEFLRLVDPKFRKGDEEHGGSINDLTPVQLVNAAIEEAIDQVVYLITLRHQL